MGRQSGLLAGLLTALFFVGACGSAATTAGSASTAAGPPGPMTTPAPGTLTIAALGDSLTAGDGDDSSLGGYPGRLQALLDPVRPGTKILNLGHSGWSSTDLIDGQGGSPSELAQAVAAHPNVALVWIGSNDLWNLYEYGPEPMTTEAERADLAAYETHVDAILRELTGHGALVFLALLDDQSKRPVVARPNPTEPAFPGTTAADLALMSADVKAYNDIIRRTAARYDAATVDFYDTTIFTAAATLSGDGNHPNSKGLRSRRPDLVRGAGAPAEVAGTG
jgi:lysophospholipase L1-like esterase